MKQHSTALVRQEAGRVTTVAIASFESEGDDPMQELKRAVTSWIDKTPEGREAYEESCEDFNIGDLANWQSRDLLKPWGVENLSIDTDCASDEYHFDSHLYDGEGFDECPYCGGDCPNQPEDSEHLCDGFAGDIDELEEE
jgi:hypothetical protein